tara:strand:+ start:1037 stop:1768 length:732 start_codon:yes stop_codon:yes gene_type:complete
MNIDLTLPRLNTTTMQILVVLFYSYVLIFHIKDTEYAKMLVLTFLTMILLCSMKGNILEALTNGPEQNGTNGTNGSDDPKDIIADTNQTAAPATDEAAAANIPVVPETPKPTPPPNPTAISVSSGNMSVYDGMCLQSGNTESWMKSPANSSLVDNNMLFTYLTGQGPLKPTITDNAYLIGPPVDGDVSSPNKMFMLANNRSSPNCCPSTFSTSTGCVCTTKKQRDYVNRRGNNNPLNLDNSEI